MTTLTLSNHQSKSPYRKARIHFHSGHCTLDDNLTLSLNDFMQSDFQHPLITLSHSQWSQHQLSHSPTHFLFTYEYDDIEKLFDAAPFVYSLLLKAPHPTHCIFDIKPSPYFKYRNRPNEAIYFSPNGQNAAQQLIQIQTLEKMVQQIHHQKYQFSEDIILDQRLTLKDLPDEVDGNRLFEWHPHILHLLESPPSLNNIELRYIDPTIGFGIFARDFIAKDSPVVIYTGNKVTSAIKDLSYGFLSMNDCLNLSIDGKYRGNISRFINHAPNSEHADSKNSVFLNANLMAYASYMKGMSVLVYTAVRDIAPGEQLLIDYGTKYLTKKILFTHNHQLLDVEKATEKPQATVQLALLRIFAANGILQAQRTLLFRWIKIILIILILAVILNRISD